MGDELIAEVIDRKKPSRRPFWFSAAALALSLAAVLTLVWMAFRDQAQFTAKTPVKVLTPVVRAGHSVTLMFDYCKEGNDVATVGTILARRGVMIPLNLWPSDLPVGCHKVAVALPIPDYVTENTYVLYMVREYKPTVFAVRGVSFASEPFKVLAFDGSPPAPIPFPEGRPDNPPADQLSDGADAPYQRK